MATAGSIVVDLLMRTGSFETDSRRASRQLDKLTKQIDKYAKRTAVAGVAVAGAFFAMLKSAANYSAEIGTAAERTSISTEAFSELAYAAERVSLSQGELQRILRRSTEAINHALDGTTKQADALRSLGVSALTSSGQIKTADQMLKDLAEKFSTLEPGAQKTKLAIELFGSQLGQKVIPLLNQGADGLQDLADEARRFGLVVNSDAARAADEFNANLTRLTSIAKGLAVSVGNELLPVANDFISALLKGTSETDELNTSIQRLADDPALLAFFEAGLLGFGALIDVVVGLAKAIGVVSLAFQAVWADIQVLFKAGQVLQNPFKLASGSFRDEFGELLDARTAKVGLFNDALTDLWNFQGDAGFRAAEEALAKMAFRRTWHGPMPQQSALGGSPAGDGGDGDGGGRSSSTSVRLDEGQRLIDQYRERIGLIGKMTELEKFYGRGGVGALPAWESQEQFEYAEHLARTIDMMEQAQKDAQDFKTLMDNLYPEQAKTDQMIENIRVLGEAFNAGSLDVDEFNDAIGRLTEGGDFWQEYMDGLAESMEDFSGMAASMLDNLAQSSGDAFASMILDADSFGDSIARMAQGMSRAILSALGEMGARWLIFQGIQALGLRTTQSSAATMMMGNATAQSLQAGLAAYASTAAIPITGPAAAPGAMAAAISATSPMIGAIGSAALSGMAHDGIDSVPETGTWLLEKGERVVTSQTSAKLDAMLDKAIKGQKGGNAVAVTINIADGKTQTTAPSGWEGFAREIGDFVDARFKELETRSNMQGGMAWSVRQGVL